MPPPGSLRPAVFAIELRDMIWETLYAADRARRSTVAAGLLNHLQFLTIRRYLSLVFGALVILLLVLAAWS